MADGSVGVFDESGAGTKKVDVTELTVGSDTVERQRIVIAGAGATEVADVKGAAPSSGDMGIVVRPIVAANTELDGHSQTLGSTTDAAVDSNIAGTVSGKLRGLIKILADVWDSVAHKLRVDTGLTQPLTDAQLRASSVPVIVSDGSGPLTVDGTVAVTDNAGSLTVDAPVGTPVYTRLSDGAAALIGQKTKAASLPVALASDQDALPVTDNSGSLTVDAPVGTPVYTRLSDGAAALVGQKAKTASLPVVLASDQDALPITDNGGSLTVDGTVATTAADGSSVALGATTDAAVDTDASGTVNAHIRGLVKTTGAAADAAITTNTTGSISGKLRGLVAIFADVWDSTNHFLKVQLSAGENHIGEVGLRRVAASIQKTRPADTTQYTTGDLVANSTTGASVTMWGFPVGRTPSNSARVTRVRMYKNSATTTNAMFRLHLLTDTLTYTTGDNSPIAVTGLSGQGYIGYVDVVMDQVLDGKALGGAYCDFNLKMTGTNVNGILEARADYAPASSEIFIIVLDAVQD